MSTTVCKFGGTSLANAAQFHKVVEIVRADPGRRLVVVSAPGRRFANDPKVTDLLIEYVHTSQKRRRASLLASIKSRFEGLVRELGLSLDFSGTFEYIRACTDRSQDDFIISRGEYLSAQIMAAALGFLFIDATSFVQLTSNGVLNMRATRARAKILATEDAGVVVPGFYGMTPGGQVKTFSRGGSDLTGSIVAAVVGAGRYENWTDVSGLSVVDPRIVPNARIMNSLTQVELRELSYGGAEVLHPEVVVPLRGTDIPINLRNTNSPDDPGTVIVPEYTENHRPAGAVVGIAGRRGFTLFTLRKFLMNNERGFLRRLCGVFERHGLNIEHVPGSVDTISVVVESAALNGKIGDVLSRLRTMCRPDSLEVDDTLALICVVGAAMAHTSGMAARLFGALGAAQINVRLINQGSSEISIIVGVHNADFEAAIHAIYQEFFPAV